MTIVIPLTTLSHIDQFFDLYDYHFEIFVARVKEEEID